MTYLVTKQSTSAGPEQHPVQIFAVKTDLGRLLPTALCACHSGSVLFINSNELPMLLYSIVQLSTVPDVRAREVLD